MNYCNELPATGTNMSFVGLAVALIAAGALIAVLASRRHRTLAIVLLLAAGATAAIATTSPAAAATGCPPTTTVPATTAVTTTTTSTTSTTTPQIADLAVTATASATADEVTAGPAGFARPAAPLPPMATFEIMVTNHGPDPATDVELRGVSDTPNFGAGAQGYGFTESPGVDCVLDTETSFVCDVHTLASGASGGITILVRTTQTVTIEAEASASTPDPDPSNNTASVTSTTAPSVTTTTIAPPTTTSTTAAPTTTSTTTTPPTTTTTVPPTTTTSTTTIPPTTVPPTTTTTLPPTTTTTLPPTTTTTLPPTTTTSTTTTSTTTTLAPTTTLPPGADVQMTAIGVDYGSDGSATFRFTATNAGPDPAPDTTVYVSAYPATTGITTSVSVNGVPCPRAGTTGYVCPVGTMEAGSSMPVEIASMPAADYARADIVSTTADPDPSNNSAWAQNTTVPSR